MKPYTLLLMMLGTLLLAACGGPTPARPAPTETPAATVAVDPDATVQDANGVPLAMLTKGETTVLSAVGSYCWGGICADKVGTIVPNKALHVAANAPLTFTLTAGEPSNVNLSVLGWQLSEFDQGGDLRIIAREAPLVSSGDLAAAPTIEWQAPSEPGEYALALFTHYTEGGDIAYGWHLIVD